MTIQAVFFDFGGVLLQHADGIDHKAIEARLGLEERTLFRCLYRDSRYMDYQVGGCTHEEWIESIRGRCRDPRRPGAGGGADERLAERRAAAQPAHDLARRTAARGRLPHGHHLEHYPRPGGALSREVPQLIPLFDVRIGSGDIGLAKPDPAIFQHALREMGVAAEASVFADDVRSYADAARAVGMHGFYFTGYDQFAADLRSVGVDV